MKPQRRTPIPPESIAGYFGPPTHPTPPAVPPLTVEEYVSPRVFPLTTRPGLATRDQFLIDAVNLERLRQYRDAGHPLTDRKRRVLIELEVKEQARPELIDEAEAAG